MQQTKSLEQLSTKLFDGRHVHSHHLGRGRGVLLQVVALGLTLANHITQGALLPVRPDNYATALVRG